MNKRPKIGFSEIFWADHMQQYQYHYTNICVIPDKKKKKKKGGWYNPLAIRPEIYISFIFWQVFVKSRPISFLILKTIYNNVQINVWLTSIFYRCWGPVQRYHPLVKTDAKMQRCPLLVIQMRMVDLSELRRVWRENTKENLIMWSVRSCCDWTK